MERESPVGKASICLFSGCAAVTVAALSWVGWSMHGEAQSTALREHRANELHKLGSTILLLDEVLTMSARMAAATGDLQWEARYRKAEVQLDEALRNAIGLGADPERYAVEATSAANERLVALENQAFDLVRRKDLDKARLLLGGTEYASLKDAYSAGIRSMTEQIESSVLIAQQEATKEGGRRIAIVSIILVVLTCGWIVLFVAMSASRRNLAIALDRLQEHATELAELNRGLDAKVAERTQTLERTLAANRQLIETMSSALIGLDGNGLVTNWNVAAQHMLGVPADAVLGRPLANCPLPWDGERVNRAVRKSHSSDGVSRISNVPTRRSDGRPGFLNISANSVRDPAGSVVHTVVIADDVTEHRALESQLGQSQKLESIGRLAAGIAHEINTPTQFIGDNVRFLESSLDDILKMLAKYRELLGPDKGSLDWTARLEEAKAAAEELEVPFLTEEIPRAVAQTLEGVNRVSKIVRSMKEFSHPGGDSKTTVDLNRAIESTITVARNEWKYVADLEMDFDPNLPAVTCLPGEVNQVMLNILINAAQAIGDVVGDGGSAKGRIVVSTRHVDDAVEIRISDTGSGIPEEHRSKIFDPFFTTKEVGLGTGQGLAIAYNVVVEKHGGSIHCESEVGRGTTFVLRLPLCPSGGEAVEAVA